MGTAGGSGNSGVLAASNASVGNQFAGGVNSANSMGKQSQSSGMSSSSEQTNNFFLFFAEFLNISGLNGPQAMQSGSAAGSAMGTGNSQVGAIGGGTLQNGSKSSECFDIFKHNLDIVINQSLDDSRNPIDGHRRRDRRSVFRDQHLGRLFHHLVQHFRPCFWRVGGQRCTIQIQKLRKCFLKKCLGTNNSQSNVHLLTGNNQTGRESKKHFC